eukprot:10869553-Alexandrium_andersonii.AAC.1
MFNTQVLRSVGGVCVASQASKRNKHAGTSPDGNFVTSQSAANRATPPHYAQLGKPAEADTCP